MRLGVVTFHYAPSYGAFFQAYALAKYLQEIGHSVEVVDYMPRHRQEAFGRRHAKLSFRRMGVNRSNVRWFREWTRIGYYLSRRYVHSRAVSGYLPLTKTRYLSLQQLQQDPPELDACFFGSDQIWNCTKTGGSYDPAYFGDFGPKEMRRIAYAASFGRDEALEHRAHLTQLLALLDRVSVREDSGVAIVRANSDKQAGRVLDPTFLISPGEYPTSACRRVSDQYVLGYFIGDSTAAKRILHHVGRILQLPVVHLTGSEPLVYPGPLQMLTLLRSARYIVTNSFHGLALALIHQIDFTSVGLVGYSCCLNVRMVNLLANLGLIHRYISPEQSPAQAEVDWGPVQWSAVNGMLEEMRADSKRFIAESLVET